MRIQRIELKFYIVIKNTHVCKNFYVGMVDPSLIVVSIIDRIRQ